MNQKFRRFAALLLVVPGYLIAALQVLPGVPIPVAELARFVPYYWLLPLAALSILLLWRLSWWLMAVVVLNPVLVLTFHMGLHWNQESAAATPDQALRVMTFNSKSYKVKHVSGGMAALVDDIRLHDADVVALQDADGFIQDRHNPTPRRVTPMLGYPEVFVLGQYLIASRFPIRECSAGDLSHSERSRNFLRCTLLVRGIPLTVVTAHFVSPRYSLLAVRDDPTEASSDWSANLAERLHQAQVLARALAPMPRPLVLMGDFNAPEDSPVLAPLLALDLRDAFSQAGQGWGYTYGHAVHKRIDFLRIDHILASSELEILRTQVGLSRVSDHHAVIADLRLSPASPALHQPGKPS